MNSERIYQFIFSFGSAVTTALSPTLPYILLCTVAVLADCFTAWQLDKRVRKTYPDKTSKNSGKFKSSHFGSVLITLLQVYLLLIFAHFLHVYVTGSLPFNALKLAAGLVIGWQLWSCLENMSSCNGAKWAMVLQQIMVDKTARHFDIDPAVLEGLTGRRPEHLGDGTGEPMNNGRQRPSAFMATTLKPKPVVILGTAHGSNVPGKCSPDGKFREYRFSRDVIALLKPKLESLGYLVFVDMPSDEVPSPQNTELSLRCRYVNGICAKFGKDNCVYVSIHVNAAGADGKWHLAGGWCCYTSNGRTKADTLAECFYDAAITNLHSYIAYMDEGKHRGEYTEKQNPFRMDRSDGDRDLEADFYVLRHTNCAAVLTENLFQDNRADVEFLSSQAGKEAIAALHLDAIKSLFAK